MNHEPLVLIEVQRTSTRKHEKEDHAQSSIEEARDVVGKVEVSRRPS